MPEPQKSYVSGWGNYPRLKAFVRQPIDASNLTKDLSESPVTMRGMGRSYGDPAVSSEALVEVTRKLNHFISFDEQTGMLTAEAGITLDEIIKTFAPGGWFPKICPGTKYVTLGGAISNDIHGKAHHVDGSFKNAVESFRLLTADGQILNCSREENTDVFEACFGGMGLLGAILETTTQLKKIETTYFRQNSDVAKNLDEMLELLWQMDKKHNYSVAWIDPLAKGKSLGKGVLTTGDPATIDDLPPGLKKKPLYVAPEPKLSLPVFMPDFALNNVSVRVLNTLLYRIQKGAGSIAHYEKFFFPLDAIHEWNKGYGKRGFTQYQFVIPFDEGEKYLRIILDKVAHSGCTPFLNVLKKMGKGEGLLSFPMEGYTLAIDFPITKNLPALIKELDKDVIAAGGRVYLGKDAFLTRESFRSMYPEYSKWKVIKDRINPENKFYSRMAERLDL